jgi:hypothetical protein
MYDTLRLFQTHNQGFELISKLENCSEAISRKTGEIFFSGSLKNLSCDVYESGILVFGSMPKYYFGNNIRTLTRKETESCINQLSNDLSIDLSNAKVFRFDIACNLLMKYPCKTYYQYLGESRYYDKSVYGNKSTVQYTCKRRAKLFYDKLKELNRKKEVIPDIFKKRNLLRFELRYYKRIKPQLELKESLTAEKLYSEEFYIMILKKLLEEYHSIEKIRKVNPLLNEHDLKPKNLEKIFATIGIHSIGYESALELLENSKSMLSKNDYYRAKDKIKALAKNELITTESEHIAELTEKLEQAVKFYR